MSDVVWHGAVAEAGAQVLQQQEQLATLARQQRKQPPSTQDHNVSSHAPATTQNDTHTDMSADKPKSADKAIDSVADKAVHEVTSCMVFDGTLSDLSCSSVFAVMLPCLQISSA